MNRPLLCGVILTVILAAGLSLAPLIAASHAGQLRVVPQIGWTGQGLASLDGSLLVSGMGTYNSHSLRLVSKQGALLWTLPLLYPSDAAFSPDGKWLAACGSHEGLLLNLQNCQLRFFPALSGQLVSFSPDSERLLIVRRSSSRTTADNGLLVFDLDARQTGRFPVEMSVPQTMEILAGGKVVRLRGAYGNPAMHVPRMGKAEETIHLDTGKTEREWGPLEQKWIGRGKDPRVVPMPADTFQMRTYGPRDLFWNEASGLCLLDTTAVWDIRGGRLLRSFRPNDLAIVHGFLDGNTLLATIWRDSKETLARLDVRSGKATPSGLPPQRATPSPDGKSVLVAPNRGDPNDRRVELYHLPPKQPIYWQTGDLAAWGTAAWSRDGRFLACSLSHEVPAVRLISTTDGRFDEISLAEVVAAHTKRSDSPTSFWRLALDDSGERLAVAMAGHDHAFVVIASRRTRAVETVLDGLPNLVESLQFVARDRLLTGSFSGRVQLWDLAARRPLWTAETEEQVVQFDYISDGPNVVCCNLYRSGTVLRLKDGKAVYSAPPLRASDSSESLPWTQPQLIGHGDSALAMDPESMQVRLVELATGRVALTYCFLFEGQWIVFTPEGDWDGSDQALHWVKFFDGLKPLLPADAERLRSRPRVDAALRRALATIEK